MNIYADVRLYQTSIAAGTDLAKRISTPLTMEVLKKFRIIYGSVRQHFREVEKACGISGSQLWILQEVAGSPGVGVSELAERLSIHQSTCSQLAEKLVLRGFLVKERSKEDQRRVGLKISERGVVLISKAPTPAEGVFPDALMAMGKRDLTELNRSLAKVINQLQVSDAGFADKPLADL